MADRSERVGQIHFEWNMIRYPHSLALSLSLKIRTAKLRASAWPPGTKPHGVEALRLQGGLVVPNLCSHRHSHDGIRGFYRPLRRFSRCGFGMKTARPIFHLSGSSEFGSLAHSQKSSQADSKRGRQASSAPPLRNPERRCGFSTPGASAIPALGANSEATDSAV